MASSGLGAVEAKSHSLYWGVSSGFGSTTWSQIVTPRNDPSDPSRPYNPAVLSAPIGAKEGGVAWRVLFGDRLLKNFSVQLEYTHFPRSTFTIAAYSLYPQFKGKSTPTVIPTRTDAVDVLGKFYITPPHLMRTHFFADLGVSYTRRRDMLDRGGSLGAVFGCGANYDVSDGYKLTVDAQVNTGYGKSELLPADDYIPFVYSVQLGVQHQFGLT